MMISLFKKEKKQRFCDRLTFVFLVLTGFLLTVSGLLYKNTQLVVIKLQVLVKPSEVKYRFVCACICDLLCSLEREYSSPLMALAWLLLNLARPNSWRRKTKNQSKINTRTIRQLYIDTDEVSHSWYWHLGLA